MYQKKRGGRVAADLGKGEARYKAADFNFAPQEFQSLADQGNTYAQTWLGWMYKKDRGVAKDDAEAVKSFRLAADQGYTLARKY